MTKTKTKSKTKTKIKTRPNVCYFLFKSRGCKDLKYLKDKDKDKSLFIFSGEYFSVVNVFSGVNILQR